MALIQCPECGQMISDKARKCPNCGVPTARKQADPIQIPDKQMPEAPTKQGNNRIWGIAAIAIVVVGIGIVIATTKVNPSNEPGTTTKTYERPLQERIKEVKTIEEARQLIDGTTWHYTKDLRTSEIEGWIKVKFENGRYTAYTALPSDGYWSSAGSGTYTFKEGRFSNTGEKYIAVAWEGDMKVEFLTVPCEYQLFLGNFQLNVRSEYTDKMSRVFNNSRFNSNIVDQNGFMEFGDYSWR